jgi:hypothetical protein
MIPITTINSINVNPFIFDMGHLAYSIFETVHECGVVFTKRLEIQGEATAVKRHGPKADCQSASHGNSLEEDAIKRHVCLPGGII